MDHKPPKTYNEAKNHNNWKPWNPISIVLIPNVSIVANNMGTFMWKWRATKSMIALICKGIKALELSA